MDQVLVIIKYKGYNNDVTSLMYDQRNLLIFMLQSKISLSLR